MDTALSIAPQGLVLPAVLAAVFASVVGLLAGIRYLLSTRPNPVRERLVRTVEAATAGLDVPEEAAPAAPVARDGFLPRLLHLLSAPARPADDASSGGLAERLVHAGFRGERAVASYLAAQVVLAVVVGGAAAAWIFSAPRPIENAAFLSLLAIATGFYLPPLWLAGRVRDRKRAIDHALPDALDLTITCLEAGVGMDAALDRVSRETNLSAPILSDELALASREIRAGIPRGEAFRRLARRTGVDELRALAAIIVQTELFGTSVAQTLRIQADSMRIRRTQNAEERAGKVAVKLTIPLVLCILPALFAVLLGPAVVSFVRVLMPTLGGGR